MIVRAIFRTRAGRYLEVGAEVAHEVVQYLIYRALRNRLGIPELEQRVRDLEILVDRAEAARERSRVVRFPRRDEVAA